MAQPGGLHHKNRPFMMRKRTVYDPQPGGLRIANRQASIRGQAGCASRLSVYIKKSRQAIQTNPAVRILQTAGFVY